jgi:hypothetical protein
MGISESVLEGNPTLTYGEALEWASEDFPQDFEEFWSLRGDGPPENLDPDDWRRLKELSSLAKKMAFGASTLVRPRRLSTQRLALPALLGLEAAEEQKRVDQILEQLRGAMSDSSEGLSWWDLYRMLAPQPADDPRVQRAVFASYFEQQADRLFGTPVPTLAARMLKLIPYLRNGRPDWATWLRSGRAIR